MDLPIEKKSLCIAVQGKQADFFIVKGMVETILNDIGIKDYMFKKISDVGTYHPGRTAEIVIGETAIGFIGEIHPKVLKNYSTDDRIIAAEMDMESLIECSNLDRKYKQVAKYPSIQRDLAILVKEDVTNEQIIDIIKAKGGKYLISVKLFDVYRGIQILAGHKSLAYNMIFRAEDRTLTDDEVQKPYDKIVSELVEKLGASRR